MTGGKETFSWLIGVPKKLDKKLSMGNEEWMRKVRKSAKLRAPRDRGDLADRIMLKKTITKGAVKQWKIIVASRQAVPQELGFTPHWIHSDQIEGSNKLTRGGFFWVSKNTPFIQPAIDANARVLDNILLNAVDEALK